MACDRGCFAGGGGALAGMGGVFWVQRTVNCINCIQWSAHCALLENCFVALAVGRADWTWRAFDLAWRHRHVKQRVTSLVASRRTASISSEHDGIVPWLWEIEISMLHTTLPLLLQRCRRHAHVCRCPFSMRRRAFQPHLICCMAMQQG
jgi:hypothetical protein